MTRRKSGSGVGRVTLQRGKTPRRPRRKTKTKAKSASKRPAKPKKTATRKSKPKTRRRGRLGTAIRALARGATGTLGWCWRVRPVRYGLSAGAVLFAIWLFWPYWRLSGQFSEAPLVQPSRLYEAPPEVRVGDPLRPSVLARRLEARGYRRGGSSDLARGRYRRGEDLLVVRRRRFPTTEGWRPESQLEVRFADGVVQSLRLDGQRVDSVRLEPRVLASYFGDSLRDRWPERLDDLPEYVFHAVLAAEDDGFFRHTGLSPSGMLRALWVNLRGTEISQGGSTLTQQLVKNLYLTQERSLTRKVREAAISLLVELRHSKEEILQGYLNEIYLGRSGSVHLMGIGAASRAYFGIPASELSLAQAATLAGMIRSPARLSPRAHPAASAARRDEILGRMHELGWIDDQALGVARDEPLELEEEPIDLRRARYAALAAASEARERFGATRLEDAGYTLISTLDAEDQDAAEEAVRWGVRALERGWEKGRGGDQPLQSALVAIDPRTGGVQAWVGGRDWAESQFDRVRSAKRQPGSAFKPIVLASAFAERVASPVDRLADEPLTVVQAGRTWTPQNIDRQYHGIVSVREAMERSLNVATVRLALDVGLDKVIAWGRKLGLEGRLQRLPSVALGAFEVTPLELLGVYATFANGGRAAPIHLLAGALDRSGRALEGEPLAATRPVLEPGVAYLVTSVLEGVIDRGTGSRLRRDGLTDVLAGKSGTSNDRRDSWFIGYAPTRTALVWVGYDDGRATNLSGTRGALPIWGRFMLTRRPPNGYSITLPPADVVTATVDPLSGQLATRRCPEVRTEVFLRDAVPRERCELHDDGYSRRRPWWKLWGRRRGG